MQATSAFRGQLVGKKWAVAIVAIIATYLLGGATGYLVRPAQVAAPQTHEVRLGSAPNSAVGRLGANAPGFADKRTAAASAAQSSGTTTFHEPGSRLGGSRI